MRHMFLDFFAKSPLLALPVLSLVLFLLLFAVIAVRVWRRGAAAYRDQAHLPLHDEDRHE